MISLNICTINFLRNQNLYKLQILKIFLDKSFYLKFIAVCKNRETNPWNPYKKFQCYIFRSFLKLFW